jgi:DnaJ-class molecular chaperone
VRRLRRGAGHQPVAATCGGSGHSRRSRTRSASSCTLSVRALRRGGRVIEHPCKTCGGAGRVVRNARSVEVPPASRRAADRLTARPRAARYPGRDLYLVRIKPDPLRPRGQRPFQRSADDDLAALVEGRRRRTARSSST